MAEKKNEKTKTAPPQAKPAPQKADNQKRGEDRKLREDRKKRYVDGKIRKASQDTYEVISRRTDDTNDFIGILNSADNLVHQLRRRMERQENLTAEVVSKYLKRYHAIRAQLNEFNIEVSALMGFDYVPPRGLNVAQADSKVAKAA